MLQLSWTTVDPSPVANQLLAIVVRTDLDTAALAARFGVGVRDAAVAAQFTGKPGESFVFTRTHGDLFERVALFGCGDISDAAAARTLAHDAVRLANSSGATRLVLDLRGCDPSGDANALRIGDVLSQGAELGLYNYDRYLAEDKRTRRVTREVVFVAGSAAPAEATPRGVTIARAVARARDLVNGPAALVTPTYLATIASDMIADLRSERDVSITVLDRAACEARNMGCYLGVAQGSDEPPKFIHMTYRPKGPSRGRVCLIGKGVTFDSGGYSLKPTDGMLDMKMDMAGAAAVIAAFEAISRLALPWETHAIVPATENMVSGHAYRLGDVLTASNGKTVEINNTDAEGRLTLADALIYASKLAPDLVLDFATLTGACMIALGPRIAGVMAKDDLLVEDWLAAGKRTGEAMWRLPLPDDLKDQLKSKVADMKNTGERYGGAITAGLFLSEFTEGCRWLHVDIAGPAMVSKPYGVAPVGGSGFPVPTIVEFLTGEVRKP